MDGLASEVWRIGGVHRWDDDLEAVTLTDAIVQAQESLKQARIGLEGFECYLNDDNRPDIRATARSREAARYYDIHRMSRLAGAKNKATEVLEYHLATTTIAERLANKMPASLTAAAVALAKFRPEAVAREFLLWRHSLDACAFRLIDGPSKKGGRFPSIEQMIFIDKSLSDCFGLHTRSNIRARIAVMLGEPTTKSAGACNRRSGDTLIRFFVDSSAASRELNRKAIIEQSARSLIARHFWNERNRFNDWVLGPRKPPPIFIKGRGIILRGPVGPQINLRRLKDKNGLRTDYTDDFANAMANAVFDPPFMPISSREAPSRQAVFYASASFKRQPLVPAVFFTELSGKEISGRHIIRELPLA